MTDRGVAVSGGAELAEMAVIAKTARFIAGMHDRAAQRAELEEQRIIHDESAKHLWRMADDPVWLASVLRLPTPSTQEPRDGE